MRTALGIAWLRDALVDVESVEHTYLDLDHTRVWEAIGRIDDLVEFATAIERYITRG